MTSRRRFLGYLSAVLPGWSLGALPRLPASALVALTDPGILVKENVWIPMPDGQKLAARMFLPASSAKAPAGAVLEYLPYRKRDGYRYRDDVVGPYLAKRGVALVRVDIRGTGDSDGVIIDEYLPGEQADALKVIEWIAAQPWCNGHVGMRGISYGSFTALQAAAKAPPALKAIVSTCGTERRYLDDIHYRGGCLIHDQFTWAMEWQVVMRAPPDPVIVGQQRWRTMWQARLEASGPLTLAWLEHQTLDAQWQNGSISDYSTIRAAVYNVAGMLDSYLPSATRMMELAPQVPQRALIGPWAHKWPGYPQPANHRGEPTAAAEGTPGPGVDWMPVEAQWWQHWLNGEANGALDTPQIWAFREDRPAATTYPKDTPGAWVSEQHWPGEHIERQTWYLNGEGLARTAAAGQVRKHRTDLTIGFANRQSDASGDPAGWWRNQAEDDRRSLCFDSVPLEAPLDLMGNAVLTLRVQSDKPVAKVCARLTEVTPDGQSHFVTYALLNLTHREGHEKPLALPVGQAVDVRLESQFACYRFAAGSRIRVALSETWWPVVWPSPELVELGFHAGVSRIELPVRRPQPDETPPFGLFKDRYDTPGEKPAPYLEPYAGVEITGEPGRRRFNLVEGSLEPEGVLIPGAGTTYKEAYQCRRTIHEGDPGSAEIEATGINVYDRAGWQITLRAHCLCRSTATHFVCSEEFEASESGKVVFSKKWERRIPRVLV